MEGLLPHLPLPLRPGRGGVQHHDLGGSLGSFPHPAESWGKRVGDDGHVHLAVTRRTHIGCVW